MSHERVHANMFMNGLQTKVQTCSAVKLCVVVVVLDDDDDEEDEGV